MRKKACLFIAAFAAAFAGCITDTSGTVVEKGKMTVYNPGLAAHMSITHHLKKKTDAGFSHVQVMLENADFGDIRFKYRFEWYDKDGMLIEDVSPMWQTMRMHGKDRKPLECVSGSKAAEDFRLVIRAL